MPNRNRFAAEPKKGAEFTQSSDSTPVSCIAHVPPIVLGQTAQGQPVVIKQGDAPNWEAFTQTTRPVHVSSSPAVPINEFKGMIEGHNWFYDYSKNLTVFEKGYHNEQAIQEIVDQNGGAYRTIWEAESARNRPRH